MYLVTGGCGFIGSHLVDLLVSKGASVRIIDDLSNSSSQYLPPQVELISGSITDDTVMQQALKGVERIFHLAARVSVPESIVHWHQNHLINCSATVRLFELAKKIPIVFASSAAVYGDSRHLPHEETAEPHPLSPYAIDKLACEMHAKIAWQIHGTPNVGCRFFNVYGPRQNPTSPYSGVISKFANQLTRSEPVTIFGDGNQLRDFIYVKDIVNMLFKTMENLDTGSHIYNFCTGNASTINALADLMGQIVGMPVKKEYAPFRTGDIVASYGDPTRARKEMSLRAETPLKEGLRLLMQEIMPGSIVQG